MAATLIRRAHKIAVQLHLVAEGLYHMQFLLQAANPETFGYTIVFVHRNEHDMKIECYHLFIHSATKTVRKLTSCSTAL